MKSKVKLVSKVIKGGKGRPPLKYFYIANKDGTPDRRYKINKGLKADGTPDKRYKPENIGAIINATHTKADGTPDKRYKENRHLKKGYRKQQKKKKVQQEEVRPEEIDRFPYLFSRQVEIFIATLLEQGYQLEIIAESAEYNAEVPFPDFINTFDALCNDWYQEAHEIGEVSPVLQVRIGTKAQSRKVCVLWDEFMQTPEIEDFDFNYYVYNLSETIPNSKPTNAKTTDKPQAKRIRQVKKAPVKRKGKVHNSKHRNK